MDSDSFPDRIARLRARLDARAAGVWLSENDSLRLLAFEAVDGMPKAVAEGFAEATATVSLSSLPFGIVGAAVTGVATTSIAAELNPEVGSGFWLRAFRAERSIAVPIKVGGRVVAVVAVALSALDAPSDEVATTLTTEASAWFGVD